MILQALLIHQLPCSSFDTWINLIRILLTSIDQEFFDDFQRLNQV